MFTKTSRGSGFLNQPGAREKNRESDYKPGSVLLAEWASFL